MYGPGDFGPCTAYNTKTGHPCVSLANRPDGLCSIHRWLMRRDGKTTSNGHSVDPSWTTTSVQTAVDVDDRREGEKGAVVECCQPDENCGAADS